MNKAEPGPPGHREHNHRDDDVIEPAHADRRRALARLRIEHHRQHDHAEQHERHGADQPPAAAALQSIDVLSFSHAMISPTVRNEPKTTILSFSPARSFAAANAFCGESCSSNGALAPVCRKAFFSSSAVAARGPDNEAKCQRVMRGATARSTPAMSLSRSMPQTAIVCGANPEAE